LKIENHETKNRALIVAEIGNNHEGSYDLAVELLNKAVESGADAVKFQTFLPELFVSKDDAARMEILKKFQLKFEQFRLLAESAAKLDVIFFSTPLDLQSAVFLDTIQQVFKIASGDNNFFPLIDFVLSTGKPVIISTGASDLKMLNTLYSRLGSRVGIESVRQRVALLHCVSSYPVPPDQASLSSISVMRNTFPGITIGYSDHCLGIKQAVYAVSAGAEIIEKHFTIDNNYSKFRDHKLSADPESFKKMVEQIRELEFMMGDQQKQIQECEKENSALIRRSIAAARDIPAGKIIEPEDMIYIRPGTGISADQSELYIGKKSLNALKKGMFFSAREFD
jgi:sialic acid synthase SpsE